MFKSVVLTAEAQKWYSSQPPVISHFPLRQDKVVFAEPQCVCAKCSTPLHHSMIRGTVTVDEKDFILKAVGKCFKCDNTTQYSFIMFVEKGEPQAIMLPDCPMPWEYQGFAGTTKDKKLEQLLL